MIEQTQAAQGPRRIQRPPTHCKMGFHYYDERRDNRVVGSHQVPSLRLYGHWLEAGGFRVGDRLDISVDDGVLMLRRQPDPPPPPPKPARRRKV